MSNSVSALQGKVEVGEVTVREAGLRGMITLRGDLDDKVIRRVCADITGCTFPMQGHVVTENDRSICWMSPDEVLLLVPYDAVAGAISDIAAGLKAKHHLAADVSDARALIAVEGPYAREVIAKLAPVDLHPDSFAPGQFRRSRLGQVAAAFWMHDEDTFHVICFRSVADYTFRLLAASANAGPVGHF